MAEQVPDGKVAVVTGGASGIGRATAQRFVAAAGTEAGAALSAHPDTQTKTVVVGS